MSIWGSLKHAASYAVNPVGTAYHDSDAGDFIHNKFLGGDAARNAQNAANAQSASADKAMGALGGIYGGIQQNLNPYLQAGQQNLNQFQSMNNSGAFNTPGFSYNAGPTPQFGWNPNDISSNPGYQFQQQQGQLGSERSAAARGGVLGGGQQKALAGFNQGLASTYQNQLFGQANQTYQNQLQGQQQGYNQALGGYNANLQNNQNAFGRYSSLVGMGQQAANQSGQFGAQYGGQLSDLITGQGNAQASGIIGASNARNAAIGSLLNLGGQIGGAGIGALG